MATTFENILRKAQEQGKTNLRSRESLDWLRTTIRKSSKANSSKLFREEKENLVNSWTNLGFGKMYFVMYDPKHKKTLPYYDSFPIIIPIERYKDGILGLNLHYLPPVLRAKLMDALYDTLNNTKMDETTRLKVTYGIVKSTTRMSMYKPCIKRYLGKHFRSRFIRIPPENWSAAIFLPVEDFQKASRQRVWQESRRKI